MPEIAGLVLTLDSLGPCQKPEFVEKILLTPFLEECSAYKGQLKHYLSTREPWRHGD